MGGGSIAHAAAVRPRMLELSQSMRGSVRVCASCAWNVRASMRLCAIVCDCVRACASVCECMHFALTVMRVSIIPKAIALARTPSGPHSRAMVLVRPVIPALADA